MMGKQDIGKGDKQAMKRFLFAYRVVSTGTEGEFSVAMPDEEAAHKAIKARVADIEMTEEEDIEIGDLLKVLDLKDNYYECEGCT